MIELAVVHEKVLDCLRLAGLRAYGSSKDRITILMVDDKDNSQIVSLEIGLHDSADEADYPFPR